MKWAVLNKLSSFPYNSTSSSLPVGQLGSKWISYQVNLYQMKFLVNEALGCLCSTFEVHDTLLGYLAIEDILADN